MKRARRRGVMFAVVTAITAVTLLAAAQPKHRPPTKKQSIHQNPRSSPKGAPSAEADASEPMSGRGPKVPEVKGSEEDGGVVSSKTIDGGEHVFRFGEVEVEGRLQSPQIVYFLRRVRAEFAAGNLGHRSFMRELSQTRNEPSF